MHDMTEAVAFFLEYAGLSYNPATETPEEGRLRTARKLAEAEAWAHDEGHTFEWQDDWDLVTSHVAEFDCYDEEPGTCEWVRMVDSDGDPLGPSLGCVDDATDEYRRVIEAELAWEAMPAVTQPTLPLEWAS